MRRSLLTGRAARGAPPDLGLQPERTELAWRRTLLSLAVCALVSLRVLPPVLGAWTLGPGLLGVLLSVVLGASARRRQRRMHAAFEHHGRTSRMATDPINGGGLLALLAAATTAGGVLGVMYLVVHARA